MNLTDERKKYQPKIANALVNICQLDVEDEDDLSLQSDVSALFPYLAQKKEIKIVPKASDCKTPLRVGVVLSGGQAAGGHNVLLGLFESLKRFHADSLLFGFLNGPSGIIKSQYKELTQEYLYHFRNQGGFDAIGSGRTKIETEEQFQQAAQCVTKLQLDGLVIIGGDDSNTNAAYLAEYFLSHNIHTSVVGVPKTIDGDLQSENIEISFGFDTACKVYSEIIGNIARDALSNKKYYYFVKVMGRSASHIALECALQTQPNLTFIAEEVFEQKKTLIDIVDEIVHLVVERAKQKKDYGIIIIPEGLIEFLSDVRALIAELNILLSSKYTHATELEQVLHPSDKIAYVTSLLTDLSKTCFSLLPEAICLQLLLDRDPHGNVQVSKIETDRLLIQLVTQRLRQLKQDALYDGKFSAQAIFCGYEGRSAFPSNFDSDYCYNLGIVAAVLVARRQTGYIAALTRLSNPCTEWVPKPQCILSLLHFEIRDGKKKAVIAKTLVDIHASLFLLYSQKCGVWRLHDDYKQIGPMQFYGPTKLSDSVCYTIRESSKNLH